ncbi:NosD domain-containing protein, partial [Methanolobus sp.]|uniref:NosD domain-containing protein n=1 Tax=Methanolobus sp. TaxID=1874737 RepID=UPI0025F0D991
MSSVASAAPLEVDSIVQLTSGSGNEGSPVWSPDGTEMIYSRDGTIYKMALADQIEVELDVPGGKWSPDGNQVIFLNGSLWIVNKDGSSERQIPNTDDVVTYFAWSPDGTKIAYTHDTELIIIEPDGSNKQVIYTQPEYPGDGTGWQVFLAALAWSPDSSKIVVQESMGNEGEIYLTVLNADGTNPVHTGAYGINYFVSQTQPWQSQVWSPDGSKIVTQTDDIHEGVAGSVWIVNSDGTNINMLEDEISQQPSFSPDGSKIVYLYTNLDLSSSEDRNIWIMDADGSNKTQLTTSSVGNTNPVWSPDGTKIAFASVGDIWVINLKEAFVSDGVITVDDDGGADFTTIQAAVDAASAGDTILVSPGTYNENVDVDKSVIIGSTDGADVTNVIGTSSDPVFNLSADETTINGFYINGFNINSNFVSRDDGLGIHIFSASGSIVSNNIIEDRFTGISVSKSENIVLDGNLLQHNEQGIVLVFSNDNNLTGNIINGEYFTGGISLSYSDNNILDSNGGGRGEIFLSHSNNNIITNNDAVSSDVLPGINVINSNGNKLINNNAAGVEVAGDAEGNILLNNIVYVPMGTTPPLHMGGTNNTLINNTVYCDQISEAGIVVSGSNHYLDGNRVEGEGDYEPEEEPAIGGSPGIYLEGTSYSRLIGNIVTKQNGDGIRLSSSSHNSLIDNTVVNIAGYGIILNNVGIYIQELNTSYNNTITDNVVELCGGGMLLSSANENLIYNNFFNTSA